MAIHLSTLASSRPRSRAAERDPRACKCYLGLNQADLDPSPERSFFVGCNRIGVVSSWLRGEIVIEGDGIVRFFVHCAVHERHCPVTRMLQELLNRISILV
jgi:hypothetical protein